MNQEQQKKIQEIVDYYSTEVLDKSPREEWVNAGLTKAFAFAKVNGAYNLLSYASIKRALNEEITKRLPQDAKSVSEIFGFELKSVTKTGDLFTIATDKGDLLIDADDLFSSSMFRRCVFSSFGIYIKPISKNDWDMAMEIIASCIVDNKEDISQKDIVIDALSQFLSDADEREINFLKKGMPIIKDEKYIFRICDLTRLIKREFDSNIGRPMIQMTLKDLGFTTERCKSFRYWQIDTELYE